MKRCYLILVTALLMSLGASAPAAELGPVVVAPLRGEVSRAQFYFLRRALKEAERDGASAFVVEMETPGGAVSAAIEEMDALLKTKVPTYTYVNARALSAGALIAMATQKIYMSPTAVIGAAAPVNATGEDLSKTMKQKSVSALSAMARAAAQKNNHNAAVADAFIDDTKEVKIGETVVHKGDSLLTLSAEEAARVYNGKPLLATGVAASLEEMLKMAELTGRVVRIEPSGFEQVALWITGLAPLFLLGGIIGAYIEVKTPGFGVAGVISLICFGIFFTGHFIAGLTGWGVVVIFAIGVLLVLAELFLHPGTVIPGVAGVLMIIGALVWAMMDRYPSQPWWPTSDMLVRPVMNLGIALLAGVFAIYLLAKILPRTSFYHWIVLGQQSGEGPGAKQPVSLLAVAPGMTGHAHTMLRPSGKVDLDGRLVDVVSEGDLIEQGTKVRIVAVEGARVVVVPA